jgi:hypothetical protein
LFAALVTSRTVGSVSAILAIGSVDAGRGITGTDEATVDDVIGAAVEIDCIKRGPRGRKGSRGCPDSEVIKAKTPNVGSVYSYQPGGRRLDINTIPEQDGGIGVSFSPVLGLQKSPFDDNRIPKD